MSGGVPVTLRVEILPHGEGLELPAYATADSAGLDLRAAIDADLALPPGARALVPTGLKLEIPSGFEGQVRARSGLAVKHGIGLPNAPGTIDADYRGEVQVALINWGAELFTVRRGDRIAQLVIAPVARATLVRVEGVASTARDAGGFGHTGTR